MQGKMTGRPAPHWAVPLERAAEVLGVDEDWVEALGRQGRLEVLEEVGEERLYVFDSLLGMRAEDLIRAMQEKAREACPELVDQVEALAEVQFDRGRLAGGGGLYAKVKDEIEEMGRDLRAMQESE